jgi:pimeloyl-ACP methyl ester carboxylesterase
MTSVFVTMWPRRTRRPGCPYGRGLGRTSNRRRRPLAWWAALPSVSTAADAPVFVLVHGLGLSHRSFSRLARVLAGHGTVLAPDLPGFGSAAGPGRRLGVDELTEALLPRLDAVAPAHAGRAPLVVVGHSLGAEIAVEVARRRPHLVRALVLVGPVVDPAAASAFGQGRRLLLDMAGEPPLTAAMVTRDYVRGGPFSYAAGARSMLRYDTVGRLRDVAAPLLVLRGAHDPIAPRGWVAELAGVVEDGTSADVPGGVHNVVHSRPDEVGRLVLAFLEGVERRAEAAERAPAPATAPDVEAPLDEGPTGLRVAAGP